MVGQFPHGIAPHVRNLQWALSPDDHIFIVTLNQHIREFGLKNSNRVTYTGLEITPDCFVHFWEWFGRLLRLWNVQPSHFLLMEEDIYFHKKIDSVPDDARQIVNYVSLNKHYHAVTVGGVMAHPRVSEIANLVSADLVFGAIERGVNFAFVETPYFEVDRAAYEARVGGRIGLSEYRAPDTLDDFGYYCYLDAGTHAVTDARAVHLRGPETLHRRFPSSYHTAAVLPEAQNALRYMDVYLAAAVFYIFGAWKQLLFRPEILSDAAKKKLLLLDRDWLTADERLRLYQCMAD